MLWSASGSYVRALPDIGQQVGPVQLSNNPSLSYKLQVSQADTYTVWVRGMAPDPDGDSLHVLVDGNHIGALFKMQVRQWSWAQLDMSGGDVPASLNGLHDLDLHMREDGLRVDKVVLTSGQAPTGTGPAESPTTTVSTDQARTTISYTYDVASLTQPIGDWSIA